MNLILISFQFQYDTRIHNQNQFQSFFTIIIENVMGYKYPIWISQQSMQSHTNYGALQYTTLILQLKQILKHTHI